MATGALLVFFVLFRFQSLAFRIRRNKRTSAAATSGVLQIREEKALSREENKSVNATNTFVFRVDNTSMFSVPVHKDIVKNAFEAMQAEGAMVTVAAHVLTEERIGPDGLLTLMARFQNGVAWPDCPMWEDRGWAGSCAAGIPLHHGFAEMAAQLAHEKLLGQAFNDGAIKAGKYEFLYHGMSSLRASIQHHHASPLPPVHREPGIHGKTGKLLDPPHLATVSNRQVRSKVLQQCLEWACKGFGLYKMWWEQVTATGRTDETDNLFGAAITFLGKLFHVVQDSYSESHALRAYACENKLEEVYIWKLLSMDDVIWDKHVGADTLKKKDFPHSGHCAARAREATMGLLNIMLGFLADPGGHQPDDYLESINHFLCRKVFIFGSGSVSTLDNGAGGTYPKVSKNAELAKLIDGANDWTAEFPRTKAAKRAVGDYFLGLLVDISLESKGGWGFIDPRIPYWYPFNKCPAEWDSLPWWPNEDASPRCKNVDLCMSASSMTCNKLFALPEFSGEKDAARRAQKIKEEQENFLRPLIAPGGVSAAAKQKVAALKKKVGGLFAKLIERFDTTDPELSGEEEFFDSESDYDWHDIPGEEDPSLNASVPEPVLLDAAPVDAKATGGKAAPAAKS